MKSHVEGKELVLEDGQRLDFNRRFNLNKHLDLRYTGITALPANLTVGGYLNLRDTGITTLPDDLKVGGEIIGFNPAEECNNDMGM